jgi:hypothetical protein
VIGIIDWESEPYYLSYCTFLSSHRACDCRSTLPLMRGERTKAVGSAIWENTFVRTSRQGGHLHSRAQSNRFTVT